MPVANHLTPNLAIERLAQVLRAAGAHCEPVYGTLRYSPALPLWLLNDSISPIFFAPQYYDEPVDLWKDRLKVHMDGIYRRPLPADYWARVDEAMQAAPLCVQDCLQQLLDGEFDVVGFSVGFDSQRLPSATLAKALRQARPAVRIMAGGTACDGVMGKTLLELFPDFDVAVSGEAEATIVDIVANLSAGGQCTQPGVWTRGGTPPADVHPVTTSLGTLPPPNYDSFYKQVAESTFAADFNENRTVFYEASRGCWYGIKNHCTFCGIRAVDFPYRSVSEPQFIADIEHLQTAWNPHLIYLTDAILSRESFSTVVPQLQQMRRDRKLKARIFAETKSNLSAEEVLELAKANIIVVQPGIESFLTSTLRRMKKGASGVQQVELLKWCKAFGVSPMYGLLAGVPGETASDQFRLADICSALHHLPAPVDTNRLSIHRFSPYFENPNALGIRKIAPFDYQRLLYQCSDEILMRLCYEFDHEVAEYPDMPTSESRQAVIDEVVSWRSNFPHTRLVHVGAEDHVTIVHEQGGGTTIKGFDGAAAFVLERSHHAIGLASLLTAGKHFGTDALMRAVDELLDYGYLLRLDERYLNLAVPSRPAQIIRRRKTAIPLALYEPA